MKLVVKERKECLPRISRESTFKTSSSCLRRRKARGVGGGRVCGKEEQEEEE